MPDSPPGHPSDLSRRPGPFGGSPARLSAPVATWPRALTCGRSWDRSRATSTPQNLDGRALHRPAAEGGGQHWPAPRRSRPTSPGSTAPSTSERNPLLTWSLASFWRDASWASPRPWTEYCRRIPGRLAGQAAAARRSLRRPAGGHASGQGTIPPSGLGISFRRLPRGPDVPAGRAGQGGSGGKRVACGR